MCSFCKIFYRRIRHQYCSEHRLQARDLGEKGISPAPSIRGKIALVKGRREQARISPRERQEEADRFTSSLAGFAVALLLGLLGLWVADGLAQVSKLENCLMQGRMNCERIELSPAP
jgi:hypothetical protein